MCIKDQRKQWKSQQENNPLVRSIGLILTEQKENSFYK